MTQQPSEAILSGKKAVSMNCHVKTFGEDGFGKAGTTVVLYVGMINTRIRLDLHEE